MDTACVVVAELADDPLMTDELDTLMHRLRSDGPREVVLDFSAVTFLTSSNIARLLRLRKLQQDSRRRLRLCGLSEPVRSVFVVTGLDALMVFAPSRAAAMAELGSAQK